MEGPQVSMRLEGDTDGAHLSGSTSSACPSNITPLDNVCPVSLADFSWSWYASPLQNLGTKLSVVRSDWSPCTSPRTAPSLLVLFIEAYVYDSRQLANSFLIASQTHVRFPVLNVSVHDLIRSLSFRPDGCK